MTAAIALLLAAAFAVGCGSGDESVRMYLKQRLGPDGPRGQIAAVLEPVARPRRPELPRAAQVLVQLRQGPTPDERAQGFEPTFDPGTRFPHVRVRDGTAFVDVAGEPLDYYGVASVVLSLTELASIERVRVCCVYRHDGSRVLVHTRAKFSGTWQGTPCELRAEHRCLRDL